MVNSTSVDRFALSHRASASKILHQLTPRSCPPFWQCFRTDDCVRFSEVKMLINARGWPTVTPMLLLCRYTASTANIAVIQNQTRYVFMMASRDTEQVPNHECFSLLLQLVSLVDYSVHSFSQLYVCPSGQRFKSAYLICMSRGKNGIR